MTAGFDYRSMVHTASIGVVRRVLEVAAAEGFPGAHHAYLTFASGYPGVEMPAELAARYPETMTIVLQNQYWDLEVGEAGFAVSLRFDDAPRRLAIPYEALTTFIDPSVPFGLDLATFGGGGEQGAGAPETTPGAAEAGAAGDAAPDGGGEVLPFRPR